MRKDNTIYAVAKNIRMAPRKVRLIVDIIRGKNALEMSEKLAFVNKTAAKAVNKVLKSAMANAKHNANIDPKKLIISEVFVDEAFTLKRGKAVSKGRYHRIFRRNSHITIGLSEFNDK